MKRHTNSHLVLKASKPEDIPFIYKVYASTRLEEMALTGWPQAQIEWFLHMQFDLQHSQWQQNYSQATFDLILLDGNPVGRFYVDRRAEEIRIVDIAILPEYRGQGIGSFLLEKLKQEARQKNQKLSLHVEKNNSASKLYQRMGFELVQEGAVYDLLEAAP